MANKNKTFFEIGRDAMVGMIEDLKAGRPLTTRQVEVPSPPEAISAEEIIRLRTARFGVSQDVFAKLLNVSPKTVQAWEQGRNAPTGATLRLIRLAQETPDILLKQVRLPRRRPLRERSVAHPSTPRGRSKQKQTTPPR